MDQLKPDEKVCPYCAEVIKAAAVKCRYCQSDLADTPAPPPPPAREPEPWAAEERAETGQPIPFLGSFRLLVSLVVVCLVLAGVAAYAWHRSENPSQGAAPDGAITSAQARDAGMQAAAQLTQKVLSYDWKTLDSDTKAAEAVLAPSFRSEYEKTMAKVKDQTVKNQVKLQATAEATSIVSATENKVVALVFVNQSTTARGATGQRLTSSRVLVTLTRDAGEWRVSELKPL